MTTRLHGTRGDAGPADRSEGGGTEIPAGAPGRMTGWTPVQSEAARFVGECFAVDAVLAVVAELARPVWEKHHG